MAANTGPVGTAPVRADRLRNDRRILQVAAELLVDDPGVTMRAIADAAGVARPTVYRRFPDRPALIVALRSAIDDELGAALADVPGWRDGTDVMGELVRALVGVAARYPVARLRYAPVPADAPAADAQVSDILRAGQRAGRLRQDLPAETLHAALFGVLSAVLDGPDRADPDRAAATVLTLLLPGLRPQAPTPSPDTQPPTPSPRLPAPDCQPDLTPEDDDDHPDHHPRQDRDDQPDRHADRPSARVRPRGAPGPGRRPA